VNDNQASTQRRGQSAPGAGIGQRDLVRARYHHLHRVGRIAGRDALEVGQHVGAVYVDARGTAAVLVVFVVVTSARGATRRAALIDEHCTTADGVLLKLGAG